MDKVNLKYIGAISDIVDDEHPAVDELSRVTGVKVNDMIIFYYDGVTRVFANSEDCQQ